MNKRGDITAFSLLELGLVVLFIISAIIIGIALGRLFNPSQQGNFESFRTLTEGIDILLDSEEDKCWEHFLITEGNSLVGFGKEQSQVKRIDNLWRTEDSFTGSIADYLAPDEVINRPEQKCEHSSSCLVMCNVDSGANDAAQKGDCNGRKLLDVKKYPKVKEFKLTRETYNPDAANLAGLSDLLYLGIETDLEYFLIVKDGKKDDYTIVLARPEHVIGLDPTRNFKNCHNLKAISGKKSDTEEY